MATSSGTRLPVSCANWSLFTSLPLSVAFSTLPSNSFGNLSVVSLFSFSRASNSSSVFGPSVVSAEPGFAAAASLSNSRPLSLAFLSKSASSLGKLSVEPTVGVLAITGAVAKKLAPIITEAAPSANLRMLYVHRFSKNRLSINS